MRHEILEGPTAGGGRSSPCPSRRRRRLGGLAAAAAVLAPALAAVDVSPATAAVGGYSRATLSGAEGDVLVGPSYTRFDQITASRSGQVLTATFSAPGQTWTLTVQPETGETLGVGRKDITARTPSATQAGLDLTGTVNGQSRVCPELIGGYEIRALDDDPGGPSFGLDYYVRCGAMDAPVSTGFVAYRLAPGPIDEHAIQAGDLQAVDPVRIYDSRQVGDAFDPDEERAVDVTVGAVPADALAVVLNVTGVDPTQGGYLTVYPVGTGRPEASNLNLRPGHTVPNLVTSQIGSTGEVNVYNSHGRTHVVIDLVGYYAPSAQPGGARFRARQPARVLDTRTDSSPLRPNQPRDLVVADVAPNAIAVLNVTVDQPATAGFVTVYPGDLANRPLASNLNYMPGDTVPNLVMVRVSADSRVKLETNGITHLIVDLVGTFVADEANPTGRFVSMAPERIIDTRRAYDGGPLGPDNLREFGLAGLLHRYPSEVAGLVFNTTVADTTAHSYLTVWPSSQLRPVASNLNWRAGDVRSNLVVMGADPYGFASFYNADGHSTLILDAAGWFTA